MITPQQDEKHYIALQECAWFAVLDNEKKERSQRLTGTSGIECFSVLEYHVRLLGRMPGYLHRERNLCRRAITRINERA